MSTNSAPLVENKPKVSDIVSEHLPYLRRYARALTGSQKTGDAYALATLEAVLASPRDLMSGLAEPRVDFYRLFHSIWESSGAPVEEETHPLAAAAQRHMQDLTPKSREALLLNTIEEFTPTQISQIMELDVDEVHLLLDRAHEEMQENSTGKILIIEDEAIIAVDLEAIVSELGHQIIGVARTQAAAIELAKTERPDLILSDIQLADNSSGIDAVNDILKVSGDIPVIFITAFPARLLTAERPEPAFLISKPYRENQVRAAVSQAMFFSSTKDLSD